MAPTPELQRVRTDIGSQRVAERTTDRIRELAERQHGVVARHQLSALGLGERLVTERCHSGHLLRIHRGVFALGHRSLTREAEWLAAVLACGPGALLSHGSAAHLWGMRRSRGQIEVLRTSGHRRPHGVRMHQTRRLLPFDATAEAGIPVTSIERTLADLAGRLDARQLERALVAADRSGRLSWAGLSLQLARGRGRKGIGRLRRVAGEVDPNAVDALSVVEIDFLTLCRRFDLPAPQVNVLIEGFLVDFLWPKQRLIVETDSYGYHSDRPAFERDRERTVALAAAGYVVHRATPRMLSRDPKPFFALLRRQLAN